MSAHPSLLSPWHLLLACSTLTEAFQFHTDCLAELNQFGTNAASIYCGQLEDKFGSTASWGSICRLDGNDMSIDFQEANGEDYVCIGMYRQCYAICDTTTSPTPDPTTSPTPDPNTPDPNTPLHIVCDSMSMMLGPNIDDSKSKTDCAGATINCPTNAECTVECIADPFADPNITDFKSVCAAATINCPTNDECTVECNGDRACDGATINWPTVAGLGHLICKDYLSACRNVTAPIPDPNTLLHIVCDSSWECAYEIINCPTNAECIVECIAYRACYEATINWPTDVDCIAKHACLYATINWPSDNGLGNLICEGDRACLGVTAPSAHVSMQSLLPFLKEDKSVKYESFWTLPIEVFIVIGIIANIVFLYCYVTRKRRVSVENEAQCEQENNALL